MSNVENQYDIAKALKPNLEKQYDSFWIGPGTNPNSNLIFSQLVYNDLNNCYFDKENYYIAEYFDKNNNLKYSYKINSHGFRSNHFNILNNNKVSILTGGCSNSFGQELPVELRWQSFLLNKLTDKNFETFDISSMGASIRIIIKNVFSFIRNYGKPNYIFLVFPNVARDFLFNSESNNFVNVYVSSDYIINSKLNEKNAIKKYSLNFNENDAFMIAVEHIFALEEFCKYSNVKFFWTTWDKNLENFIDNYSITFKNFIPLDIYGKNANYNWQEDLKYKNNFKNLPYWEYADDGNHFGSKISSYIGDTFFEKGFYDKNN